MGRVPREMAAYSIMARKKSEKEEEGPESQYPSQENMPSDLTFFHQALLLNLSINSQWHHGLETNSSTHRHLGNIQDLNGSMHSMVVDLFCKVLKTGKGVAIVDILAELHRAWPGGTMLFRTGEKRKTGRASWYEGEEKGTEQPPIFWLSWTGQGR